MSGGRILQRPSVRGLLVIGSITLAPALSAAPPAAPPSSTVPPTSDQLDHFKPQLEPQTQPPRVHVEGQIESAPCALADQHYADIKLRLSRATFHNLGPVAESEIAGTYSDYIGKELPISVVCQIRDAAATKLRKLGYLAAVQIPTQRIENGEVTFEVLYAKLTSIRVVGKPGNNDRVLERYLQKLITGHAFNRIEAERYILLSRDIPGYDLKLSLKPEGTGAGNMVGEVSLNYTPVAVQATVQNRAASSTGPYSGQLQIALNGLTGLGDQTTIAYYASSEFRKQNVLQFGHSFLIGSSGLRLSSGTEFAWTKPNLGPTIPSLQSYTFVANGELNYPIARSLGFSAHAAVGFDYVDQSVQFAGVPLSRDHLRVGYVKLNVDAADIEGYGPNNASRWRASGSVEIRQGLNIFGASPNCVTNTVLCATPGYIGPSIAGASPTATLVRASATLDARVIDNVTLSLAPRAQLTSTPLFSFEQMSDGNYTIGRGFDPGILVGDRGFGFASEVRLDPFRISPRSTIEFAPYAFTDHSWLSSAVPGASSAQYLASVGGGVRLNIVNRAYLDMSTAVPLTRVPGEPKLRPVRFLFSLSAALWPWRIQ